MQQKVSNENHTLFKNHDTKATQINYYNIQSMGRIFETLTLQLFCAIQPDFDISILYSQQ